MSNSVIYELTWIAGSRPPVHPNPMTGRQSFDSISKAYKFWLTLASDAQFISLQEISTTSTDSSLIFKNILEEEKENKNGI